MGSDPAQLPFSATGTDDDLAQVTFVVVDLETTGGPAAEAGITEIGAVKVRGGQVLGEFATLVQPGTAIPAYITALTGITDAAVADAPLRAEALTSFWQFAHDCVLVAHNAPYDLGFLRAAATLDDLPWPHPHVVDTVTVARSLLPPGEVRNNKLSTLAAHFRAPVVPSHRALDDARATVAVLHGLLERAGSLGVRTLGDLLGLKGRVEPARRAKRHLAAHLPQRPGVYLFEGPGAEVLYVGTAGNLRERVRTYFTASEQRRRIREMVAIATGVHTIVCATALEANVREIRAIAERSPRYNRRSRFPGRAMWIGAAPAGGRLTLSSAPPDPGLTAVLGPYPGRGSAAPALELLSHACAGDPGLLRTALTGDIDAVGHVARERMAALAAVQQYEDAARWRERLRALATGSLRAARLRALATAAQVVAAEQSPDGGWQVHVIRYGRLAAAGTVPPGVPARPHVDALIALAEHVLPPASGLAAYVEEIETLMRWLSSGRARLVECEGTLALPLRCGGALAAALPIPSTPTAQRRSAIQPSSTAPAAPERRASAAASQRPATRSRSGCADTGVGPTAAS